MKFRFYGFSCETEAYKNGENLMVHFYEKEEDEKTIHNMPVISTSYAYLCMRVKENAASICGWVDESVFNTDEMIEEAVEFIIHHSSDPINIHRSYHIHRVKLTHQIKYISRSGQN